MKDDAEAVRDSASPAAFDVGWLAQSVAIERRPGELVRDAQELAGVLSELAERLSAYAPDAGENSRPVGVANALRVDLPRSGGIPAARLRESFPDRDEALALSPRIQD